jgi:uncharacterized protein YukE
VKNFYKILSGILTAIIIAGSVWVFFNVQSILDWWALRNYVPSSSIAALSRDASFSSKGEKLFYVHYPELLTKPNFNGKCTLTEETIVLGCYISRDKIYVFDVEDDRLEGVEQVTAAHEMLHAAYDRLSDDERDRIDKLTLNYYEASDNKRLVKTIESYRVRDPSVVPNELHSILATEIRELPIELEEYYSQYFINRLAVVDFAENYEDEFTKLENQIEAFDVQLKDLSEIITTNENQLELLGAALSRELKELEALKSSPSEYNNAVPSYNQKVQEYNSLLNQLRAEIANFNEIVRQRNQIATEEQSLIDAIDTRAIEL